MTLPRKTQPTISSFFKTRNKLSRASGDEAHTIENNKEKSENQDNKDQNRNGSKLQGFNYNSEVHAKSEGSKKRNYKLWSYESADGKKETKKHKISSKVGTSKKLTPLEQQFVDLKHENQDKILAIQVGYKYKFFGEDGVTASKILNIMLVPGNMHHDIIKEDRFAYCSIPDNRLHIHLKRLLNCGLKVGVVKQTETAAIKAVDSKSGLFEREITGIYTRATYMGDEDITAPGGLVISSTDDDLGDYILCINASDAQETALVAVQPLTGEIIYDQFQDDIIKSELETRLAYLRPSEIILVGRDPEAAKEIRRIAKLLNLSASIVSADDKDISMYAKELSNAFIEMGDQEEYALVADFYLLNFSNMIQRCIIELIVYLKEFKLSNIFTITSNISCFQNSRRYMLLPSNALQGLEIFENSLCTASSKGTLFSYLNQTKTKMGHRLLKKWVSKPLVDKAEIVARSQAIEDFNAEFSHFFECLNNQLNKIKKLGMDLEVSLIKVHYSTSYKVNKIGRNEVFKLLKCFQEVLELMRNFLPNKENIIKRLGSDLLINMLNDFFESSSKSIVDDLLNMVNPSALECTDIAEQKVHFFNLTKFSDADIQKELNEIADVEAALDDELMKIRNFLKRPQLNYVSNLKENYLIEVRNGKNVDALPATWIKINGTKSVSRFRTPEVDKLNKKLHYHNEKLQNNCDKAFHKFIAKIDDNYVHLRSIIDWIASLDCIFSLHLVTVMNTVKGPFARPTIVDENRRICIKNGRNPILDVVRPSGALPNDTEMKESTNRIVILTGPNMGGKSSYVRQVSLMVIMTQVGCFLPCEEASLSIFDSIFIRMGAKDNILAGQSTFMVEMQECNYILKNMSSRSLIILDEIGRGTGTNDGIAIAYAILKYIIEVDYQPFVLFITHFPSLHSLEDEYNGLVANFHMSYKEVSHPGQKFPEVIFLYRLARGVVTNLYGLNVAKLAAIPLSIIEDAFAKSEEIKFKIETKDAEEIKELIQNLKRIKDH